MKRYKVNLGCRVNTQSSKSGVKWRYSGKFETLEQATRIYNMNKSNLAGIKVTDIETGEVVFEELN